ncbi:hypothetical protein BDZ89DRAFT_122244 [Hymenopellis radicata]|nr:hypothetical protein BDZ89DRAFT_122244 [Hymenopellis radicata]
MSRDLLRYHHLLFILDVLFVPPSSRSCSRSGLVSVRIRRHWTTCRLVGRLSALVVLCAFDILVPQPFPFGGKPELLPTHVDAFNRLGGV